MVKSPTRAKVSRGSDQAGTAKTSHASKMTGGGTKKREDDWREKTLAKMRRLIEESDPEIVEEVKWKKPSNPDGIPVWYNNGGICTGETYKDHIKLTFFKGASLKDPAGLFTQVGSVTRAIDIYENDEINEAAFKNLIRAAVEFNLDSKGKRST
jgi:hypothetical protein